MNRDELVRNTVGLLMQVMWTGRRQFIEHLTTHGLTPQQFYALAYLMRQQATVGAGGCPMHQVADALHLERPTLTGIVDRLERAGLVVRQRSRQDRRMWLVTPTPAGQNLLDAAGRSWYDQFNHAFDPLEPGELAHLETLLRRLVASMTIEDSSQLPVTVFAGEGVFTGEGASDDANE